MKYIIIGFAILYIAIPTLVTFMELDFIDSFREFLSEWWEAFKIIALIMTAMAAAVVAITFIVIGLNGLGAANG
jgi:uncharacterized membrane protein YuzA (DUF378 family)